MADAVTSQTLVDGEKPAVLEFTIIYDGSGEDAVKTVDVSALSNCTTGNAGASATLENMWWLCTCK